MTFITMPKNNLKNIKQLFIDCDIEVERLISKIFALGARNLSNENLEFGSAIIDLGFEKTSLGLFKNLALIHSITFPIGINHITKDISKICSLELKESELIKDKIDFLFENNIDIFDEKNNLKINYFVNSNFRKISKNLIFDVAKSRIDEIVENIKKQLMIPGFDKKTGINFFLTGENSNLINIEKYFSNNIGSDVKKLKEFNTNDNKLENEFSSCFGALKIIKDGWETEAIPKKNDINIEKAGFFSKIFGFNQ